MEAVIVDGERRLAIHDVQAPAELRIALAHEGAVAVELGIVVKLKLQVEATPCDVRRRGGIKAIAADEGV